MHDQEPTIRARELGLALERAIAVKGWTQADLASAMGWSHSRVSRLIAGKRLASPEDMSAVLAVCGIVGPKRAELLGLAKHAAEPGWWQELDDRLPARLLTLIEHEDSAIKITEFQTGLVPGLLQCESYMRALMNSLPVIPPNEIDERVTVRLMRQFVLDRKYPARFRFFLDEYVLTHTGFGRRIMSDQVHHLLRMAARDHVEIQVIPEAAGVLPFKLMEYTELNPVVSLENMTSVLFIERTETTGAYRRIVADLEKVALDKGRSSTWLANLARTLGEPREEHDADGPPDDPDVGESSFTDTGECVELAWPAGSGVVRDSKNPSPTLVIDRAGLVALIAAVRTSA